MTKIQIDTDIPLPLIRKPSEVSAAIEALQKGQSFFVAGSYAASDKARAIAHRIKMARAVDGEISKFATRTVTENGTHGVRVWRLA